MMNLFLSNETQQKVSILILEDLTALDKKALQNSEKGGTLRNSKRIFNHILLEILLQVSEYSVIYN